MRLLLLSALLATAAAAQPSNWELPTSGTTVGLTVDAPLFTEGNPFDAPFAGALTTTQPAGPFRIVGELPLAIASTDGFGESETSAAIGNLQVGVEAGLPLAPVTFGGYLRVPTATASGNEAAQIVGLFTSYEQPGAFLDDVATVSAMAEVRAPVGPVPGLAVRFRAVPQVLIPTSDPDEADGLTVEDTEVFAGYAVQVVFDPPLSPVRVGGGLSGTSLLTEGEGTFGDRTQLFAGVMADARFGSFRPGVVARLPLGGELDNALNAVVGVRLGVAFD